MYLDVAITTGRMNYKAPGHDDDDGAVDPIKASRPVGM
jgi:hypothetical protein